MMRSHPLTRTYTHTHTGRRQKPCKSIKRTGTITRKANNIEQLIQFYAFLSCLSRVIFLLCNYSSLNVERLALDQDLLSCSLSGRRSVATCKRLLNSISRDCRACRIVRILVSYRLKIETN